MKSEAVLDILAAPDEARKVPPTRVNVGVSR